MRAQKRVNEVQRLQKQRKKTCWKEKTSSSRAVSLHQSLLGVGQCVDQQWRLVASENHINTLTTLQRQPTENKKENRTRDKQRRQAEKKWNGLDAERTVRKANEGQKGGMDETS